MSNGPETESASRFRTTHWSLVLEASGTESPAASAALERLCRSYWYPLYSFARRKGHSPHEAEDLTQGFFLRLLEKNYLHDVNRGRGKFRSFLLAALDHFMANEWDRANRLKRGGGATHLPLPTAGAEERFCHEAAETMGPEESFDRSWAETLLSLVLERLHAEYQADGQSERFQHLKPFLVGDSKVEAQAALAARLGITEQGVKSAVHRLRQRFRELFREEISHTVATRADIDEELRYFVSLMGR